MRSARPLPSPRRLLFRTKLLLKRGPGRSSLDVSSCCRCPTQVPQDRRLGVVVREARQIVFLSVVATAMSKAASNEALPFGVSKRIQVWHNQPSWSLSRYGPSSDDSSIVREALSLLYSPSRITLSQVILDETRRVGIRVYLP